MMVKSTYLVITGIIIFFLSVLLSQIQPDLMCWTAEIGMILGLGFAMIDYIKKYDTKSVLIAYFGSVIFVFVSWLIISFLMLASIDPYYFSGFSLWDKIAHAFKYPNFLTSIHQDNAFALVTISVFAHIMVFLFKIEQLIKQNENDYEDISESNESIESNEIIDNSGIKISKRIQKKLFGRN